MTNVGMFEEAKLEEKVKKLKAIVLVDNESAKKLFVKNNYKLKLYSFEKELVE